MSIKQVYYYDKEKKLLIPGYPPVPEKQGSGPTFLSDDMKPTRHPKTGEIVTSRSRWHKVNKASGCVEYKEPDKRAPYMSPEIIADIDQAVEHAAAKLELGRKK